MKYVRKRDGKLAEWDQDRITTAITKAFEAVVEGNGEIAEKISDEVTNRIIQKFGEEGVPTVEEIQDIVENSIMDFGYNKVAKAYILYRHQQAEKRELAFILNSGDMIKEYLGKNDWEIKENANIDYSVQGLNLYIVDKVVGSFWLSRIYPPEVRQAHQSGDLHIHDLNMFGPYCVGWDLQEVLMKGFPKGVKGKTTANPPKHLRVALKQSMNFMFTLSLEAAGAQAFSNFDTLLAPYVAEDNLSYGEVKQTVQEWMYDMNVGTRSGGQTPFTNITIDRTIPKFLESEPVIIGGEYTGDVYKDFQEEADMFNKALVEVFCEGDANGRIFSFPIPTYNITEDFDWDFPEFWDMVSKYGIPYFSNFLNSDISPDDVRSMCCRLRIDNRELRKRGGGFFGANPKTGSIGVVTINMPRIGYLSKDDEDYFDRLKELMEIARKGLELKRKLVNNMTDAGMYPYSRFWLSSVKEGFGTYWKNHFSTIGINGMNESCLNYFGESIETKQGHRFAEEVLIFMRDILQEFQVEDDTIYNLEATPAESTSYDLALRDKKIFSDIICANEKDFREGAEPFYTNSTHLPVDSYMDLFESLNHQDTLQTKYTGGTVFHTYLGEAQPDPNVIKKLVNMIANKFKLPYYTITPTFSVCPNCGYVTGKYFECPTCGRKCEVYSRIVGYFRPVDNWNEGKKNEFNKRKYFM
jgi:ribonucleoside-triphosphate reductase